MMAIPEMKENQCVENGCEQLQLALQHPYELFSS